MRMNLENCLRNELPRNLDWLRDQLIGHLKELRDRARKGEMIAVLHEFFDCYRFDDNQMDVDGFWSTANHPAAQPLTKTVLTSDLEDELAAAKEEVEELRGYKDYREASLTIRKYLEEVLGEKCWYGGTTICGAVARLVAHCKHYAPAYNPVRQEGPTYDELRTAIVEAFGRIAAIRDCRFDPKMTVNQRYPSIGHEADVQELEKAFALLRPLWKQLRHSDEYGPDNDEADKPLPVQRPHETMRHG